MTTLTTGTPADREAFDALLSELRPRLHRYCARMTGSVIDGEDVVQESMLKALEALPKVRSIAQPERWLFRIAHNAALDYLRRRARHDAIRSDEDAEMIVDPANVAADREVAATSLHTFMRLPVIQRSSVILMDVLGYSLQEIGEVMESSVPAVKSALHRGRARLRELAQEPDDRPPPALAESERSRLAAYVDRFNARDFDMIRNMLADDVRLDLVARFQASGRSKVGSYVANYALVYDWRFVPGMVDRRPAILVCDSDDPSAKPAYFILLEWRGGDVLAIRDFRYARYAIADAEVSFT